jgi:hypothetical protein
MRYRSILCLAIGACTMVACNALTGASDLAVCIGPSCGSTSGGTALDGGANDGATSTDARIIGSETGPGCSAAPRCDGTSVVT